MVLEKCVGVVYFKDMGEGNGFENFTKRGLDAKMVNGF